MILEVVQMKGRAGKSKAGFDDRSGFRKRGCPYYSAEFSVNGCAYQFRIWSISQMSMCLLVKEDSNVLQHLRVGGTLNMKYYSHASSYPTDYLATSIQDIIRNDQGRFKGHYLVSLGLDEA
jgi:hypothetical protein